MRTKGDSKVLGNQVKYQQNSHLHGADNPTYLKNGSSDKVSGAPHSQIFLKPNHTHTHTHTQPDGYRRPLRFCWVYIFGYRTWYVEHVSWY